MISTENSTWERQLYELAQDAGCYPDSPKKIRMGYWNRNAELEEAIRACEAITARHSRSFFLSSALLPDEKRRAMRVLYAFCRVADDLADEMVEQPAARLRELRQGLNGAKDGLTDLVLMAWAVIRERYQIPVCYAEQLLDGVELDLVQRRYQTVEDLSVYCYSVASTVGLMSMRITGFEGPQAVPYAIRLGVALQMTNILRDVGEDWRSGRLYLPLDELAAFGLGEQDVAAAVVDERWREFMRFQIARARQLYEEAMPGIALLHRDGRFAVSAAALLYRGILDDIEAHDYDVFSRRAFVSRGQKLTLLLRAFLYARQNRLETA
jgi:phytoene synthase